MTEKEFQSKLRKIEKKNQIKEQKHKLMEQRIKYNPIKQILDKMKTSNKILIIAVIAVISFTVASMYIQYKTGIEISSTLTTLWFSFWTVEIVTLAGIKVSKVIKTPFSNDTETENSENDEEIG